MSAPTATGLGLTVTMQSRVRDARRVAVAQVDELTRTRAMLLSVISWAGLTAATLGVTWIADTSKGLAGYGVWEQVLGGILTVAAIVVVLGSATRRPRIRRPASMVVAATLTAGAALTSWATSSPPAAVSYLGLAGLHVLFSMRD
jgi:hypothetical protein